MAEFEEKLNALLSNPESMAQVMQMAQSLSANMGGQSAAAGGNSAPPQQPPPPPAQPVSQAAAPPPFPPSPSPAQPVSGGGDLFSALAGGGGDVLSSLGGMLGGLDPKLITRLLPLVQELGSGQNSEAAALLQALRPFLKTERQEQVERALHLAKLIHIAKKFFAGWEV